MSFLFIINITVSAELIHIYVWKRHIFFILFSLFASPMVDKYCHLNFIFARVFPSHEVILEMNWTVLLNADAAKCGCHHCCSALLCYYYFCFCCCDDDRRESIFDFGFNVKLINWKLCWVGHNTTQNNKLYFENYSQTDRDWLTDCSWNK